MNTSTNVQPTTPDAGRTDADDPGSAISCRDQADADSEPPEPRRGIRIAAAPGLMSDGDLAWLTARLDDAVQQLACPVGELNVRVLDDAAMTALHTRHLDIDSTTDVLTFHNSEADTPIEADIAVCIDVARRQAESRRHDMRVELLLYIVHGILHCAGFDDHDENDYMTMHAEEDRILTAIGVGEVFGASDEEYGA